MSGLTIPGGTRDRVDAPRADQADAALQDLGAALQRDRDAYAVDRAEAAAAQRLNALSAEAQQIADPYEAERHWTEGAAQLRQDGPEGDDFAMAFDGLHESHAALLGPEFLARKTAAQAEALDELGTALGDTWLAASGPGRQAVEQQMADSLMRRVARGQMTPAAAAEAADTWLERLRETEIEAELYEPVPELPPDPAEQVQARLDGDPQLQELARLRGYAPDSTAAIERMADLLDEAEAVPEPERPAWIEARLAAARQQRRAALPRPAFTGPGRIDAAALSTAAARLREAWQAGRIGRDEFIRQAELLADHQEVMDA